MIGGKRLTLLLIARIPMEGRALFVEYEDAVLPLLADHAGLLERRLRNSDGSVEAHVVSFPDRASFERFRGDRRRAEAAPLAQKSGAVFQLVEVEDVEASAETASTE